MCVLRYIRRMPTNEELLAIARRALLGNYKPPPFVLARGKGCRLEDVEGKSWLDLAAGIAVVSVGHAHPVLTQAIAEQASLLTHTSNLFYNQKSIELAGQLVDRTGFDKVFFCNSGTEANEAMIKLARRWHWEHGARERKEFVATHQSFHGRTMGSLALTGQPKYHVGMEPMMGGVRHIAYGDLDALRNAVGDKTAAVILEPIQAEGGIVVGTDAYLRGAREICDQSGALLLFDEVQTGYGRTGMFLGREHSGVWPDACSLAKGIAGGFPLGAMLVSAKLADGLPPGSHATTFGGNPMACAAGLAVLRIFDDEKLVERCAARGKFLRERLDALIPRHGAAREARGRGLLQGIALADGIDPQATIAKIRERGVLLTLAGANVMRISPPLVVSEAELDEGLAAIETVLAQAPRAAA